MRFLETSPSGAWNRFPFGEARLVWSRRPAPTSSTGSPEPSPEPETGLDADKSKIDQIQKFAQQHYRDAMQTAEAERVTAESISRRAVINQEKIDQLLKELAKKRNRARELEAASSEYSGLEAKIDELERDLDLERMNVIGIKNIADDLARWDRGDISPTEFVEVLTRMHGKAIGPGWQKQDGNTIVDDVRFVIDSRRGTTVENPLTSGELPDISHQKMWEEGGIDESVKRLAIDRLSPVAGVPEKLSYLNGRLAHLEKTMKEYGLEDIGKALEKADMPKQTEEGAVVSKGLLSSMNIEFFSIGQIIDGFKKWKDAYKDALKGYNNSKSNRVAKKVGKVFSWLPFGEDVSKQMTDKVTNDQGKERKDFMEAIVTRDLGFNDLFAPNGELAKNTRHPSRFLAILEFGSQKGWLYPLMKYSFIDTKKDLPSVQAFGINIRSVIPMDYMDNDQLASYLTGLLNKSSQNGAKDMQDQIASIEGKNDLNGYMELFDKAMKGKGFWKAIGIAKGALMKAKDGATAGVLAARLNYWLRDPEIAQYMNDNILGRFAGLSWGQIPYSLALYGGPNAKEIMKWSQSGGAGAHKNAADPLTRNMLEIEQLMAERGAGKMDDLAKAKIVGRVLSGQLADLGNGQYISAFDPKLAGLRSNSEGLWPEFTEFEMRTAMPGYFANSEIVMLPESFLRDLFEISATGQLLHGPRIISYVGGIIGNYRELLKAASKDPNQKEAAANFQAEIRKKLDRVIRSKIFDRNPRDLLQLRFETDTNNVPGLKGHYAIEELLANGLLSYKTLGLVDQ